MQSYWEQWDRAELISWLGIETTLESEEETDIESETNQEQYESQLSIYGMTNSDFY